MVKFYGDNKFHIIDTTWNAPKAYRKRKLPILGSKILKYFGHKHYCDFVDNKFEGKCKDPGTQNDVSTLGYGCIGDDPVKNDEVYGC